MSESIQESREIATSIPVVKVAMAERLKALLDQGKVMAPFNVPSLPVQDLDDLSWGIHFLVSAHEIARKFQIPEQLIGTPNSNIYHPVGPIVESALAEKVEDFDG